VILNSKNERAKKKGFQGRKFFAREPTGSLDRRPLGGGHWIFQEFLIK